MAIEVEYIESDYDYDGFVYKHNALKLARKFITRIRKKTEEDGKRLLVHQIIGDDDVLNVYYEVSG